MFVFEAFPRLRVCALNGATSALELSSPYSALPTPTYLRTRAYLPITYHLSVSCQRVMMVMSYTAFYSLNGEGVVMFGLAYCCSIMMSISYRYVGVRYDSILYRYVNDRPPL